MSRLNQADGFLRSGYLSGNHYQFQPSFSDGRVRAFQWQGRNIDFLVFPCYHGAGLCAEQDSASVGASHLYGLFVDDSLWDGNYFAQPF